MSKGLQQVYHGSRLQLKAGGGEKETKSVGYLEYLYVSMDYKGEEHCYRNISETGQKPYNVPGNRISPVLCF